MAHRRQRAHTQRERRRRHEINHVKGERGQAANSATGNINRNYNSNNDEDGDDKTPGRNNTYESVIKKEDAHGVDAGHQHVQP